MPGLHVSAAYQPTGDQPRAIGELSEAITRGDQYQTLLGATATGKTTPWRGVIEQVQQPTLVIAHNKTLAAQLCNEFREYFPYERRRVLRELLRLLPAEAYLPSSDTYIEKDSSINRLASGPSGLGCHVCPVDAAVSEPTARGVRPRWSGFPQCVEALRGRKSFPVDPNEQ